MNDDSFFDTYIAESKLHLNNMEKNILDLESTDERTPLLQEIFRSAHTIKGSSAIIRYIAIKDVSHAMESLLQAMLDDSYIYSNDIISALLSACDFLNAALTKLPDTNYGMTEKDDLCDNLYRLAPKGARKAHTSETITYSDKQQEDFSHIEKSSKPFHLMFESGGIFFAAPVYNIKEVLRKIPIKPIHIVEEQILGIANYHGEILPVIDFNRRFTLFGKSKNDEERIVVFKLGEALLGVRVDALIKIFLPKQNEYQPESDSILRLFCDGYYKQENIQVHIVNIDTLFHRNRS